MSEFGRLTGVFVAPSAAFSDIARRPRWWWPLILGAIVTMIFVNALGNRIGWESVVRESIERNTFTQDLPVQQREQLIQRQARFAQYAAYAAPINSLIAVLLIAAVLKFLSDTIMGAGVGYKRMMAIVAYSYLPLTISTLLSLMVMYLKDPRDFDVQNPLAFNVAAYLGSDAPGWLRGMGGAIDLFSIWIIVLLAIGISTAARKLGFGKALGVVLFPWSLWVLVRTGLGAIGGV